MALPHVRTKRGWGNRLMEPLAREKLQLVRRLVDEILDDSAEAQGEPSNTQLTPEFSAQCTQCGQSIHWAETTNGKKAALDERPGPYVLAHDGTAVFEGSGGFAYHYDGTSEGCPAQVTDQVVERPAREWQDIYD